MTNNNLSFLFLGGSYRVGMARLFKQACLKRGLSCRIVGYELSKLCPLASEGEIVEGLRWDDPLIFEHFEDLRMQYGIDAVIPFVDPAVELAARYSYYTAGDVFAPASAPELCSVMFDKVAAANRFESLGLPIPRTYRQGDPCLRLIAKPRFGSASAGLIQINSLEKLDEILLLGDKYLIQERIDRRTEISVDCYVGVADGEIYAVSPRERLRVNGGEVVLTKTIADSDICDLSMKVLELTGLRGAVTIQFIRDLDTGSLLLMEINPRLGGGAPASVYAGADIPGLIISETLGQKPVFSKAEAGFVVTRCLTDVVFAPGHNTPLYGKQ